MALGAVEAIRSAGKTKQVMVVGVDGVADAHKTILDGRMSASVAQLPYLIGKRSAELAKDCITGRCAGKTGTIPLVKLTRGVLQTKAEPLLKYVH